MKFGESDLKSRETVRVRRARSAVSVGDFDSAEWQRAESVSVTRYWSGAAAPSSRHAEARLLHTDANLLVRFVCRQDEPLIINPAPRTEEKTIGLWDRDVCEIFVAPGSKESNRYFEFEVAPTGEWLDLEIRHTPQGRMTNFRFRSGMTAAAHIAHDHVRVTMCIPWEAFGRRPEAENEVWRANLLRCVGAGETRGYLAWQPTRTEIPDFHVPEVFGRLLFCD